MQASSNSSKGSLAEPGACNFKRGAISSGRLQSVQHPPSSFAAAVGCSSVVQFASIVYESVHLACPAVLLLEPLVPPLRPLAHPRALPQRDRSCTSADPPLRWLPSRKQQRHKSLRLQVSAPLSPPLPPPPPPCLECCRLCIGVAVRAPSRPFPLPPPLLFHL